MAARIRIGDMLVQAGMLTADKLMEALAEQKERGSGRLGDILVERGYVSEVQLTQTLSNQLSVPWVSLYHVDFSRQLLNLVPRELAERFCLIPVYVRAVRKAGDTLFVAMDDPTNEEALAAVAAAAGIPVKAMVAPPSEIKNAIRVYYGGGEELVGDTPDGRATVPIAVRRKKGGSAAAPAVDPVAPGPAPAVIVVAPAAGAPLPPPPVASAAAPVVATAPLAPKPAPALAAPPKPAPPPKAASEPAPKPATEEPEPSPPAPRAEVATRPEKRPKAAGARAKPRMISLTLLDGTTVTLPARGAKAADEPPAAEDALTAGDLVAALRAVAHGADVSDVLPDRAWEPLFAALLSILLKKHIVADWEFVEEWKKQLK